MDLNHWQAASARDEIRPAFTVEPAGGPEGGGALVIRADHHSGQSGYWTRTLTVQGGHWYRFRAVRRCHDVALPRRQVFARVIWLDADGRRAVWEEPETVTLRPGLPPPSEPEHPYDGATDADGWTELTGTYRAPTSAASAVIELWLRWTVGEVTWAEVSFDEVPAQPPRPVRLAAVHYVPQGGHTVADNCRQFAPLIAEAARQRADLVVLGECLTYVGTGLTLAQAAEPVPGPSTEYFAALARQHGLHMVLPLIERDGTLLHNTAVLLGPDGAVIGRYRKVALTRGECEQGLQPGDDYPVFQTRFGRLGIMICYDGFFPEVARQLAHNGAEVIAFPVWGCNPRLAAARAIENQVYLVSSTYCDAPMGWMVSGVFDYEGNLLAKAEQFGTVVTAEVDLNRPLHWSSLGDYRAEWRRHCP